MASWAFGLGQFEIGLFLLLAFTLYLRPAEGLRIRAQDVIRPTRQRGPFSRWGFRVASLRMPVRRDTDVGPELPSTSRAPTFANRPNSSTKYSLSVLPKYKKVVNIFRMHEIWVRAGPPVTNTKMLSQPSLMDQILVNMLAHPQGPTPPHGHDSNTRVVLNARTNGRASSGRVSADVPARSYRW